MKFLLIGISLLCFQFADAQSTVVKGLAPSYVGQSAYVQQRLDAISFVEESMGESIVKPDSTFSVAISVSQTTQVLLCLGNTCGYLYVEPGKTYNVLFDRAAHKTAYNLNRSYVEVIFEDLPETDINFRILAFHTYLDNFLQLNLYELLDAELFKALDTFKMALTHQFKDVTDPFFVNYVAYYIADIERITHVKGDRERNKAASYNNYLYRQPVLLNHPEYMRYLLNYYDNYLSLSTREFERQLYQHIMKTDVAGIRNLLATDRYLQDSLIREIVLIKGLTDLYKSGDFPSDKVERCIEKLGQESLYSQTRDIAIRVMSRMQHLRQGKPAPVFALESISGDSVKLSDFKGKHVYLSFFSAKCTPCAAELNIIPSLKEKYGDVIEFVSVAVDDTHEQLTDFVKQNRQISWPILLQDSRNQVLRDYGITSIPQYILIDPSGNILQAPALSPAPTGNFSSIDRVLFEIKKSLAPEEEDWDRRK